MAEEPASTEAPKQVTFNIKLSTDNKHVITVPETLTVADLKQKLSSADYADVPADRQRLIYSGRVLKDADPLFEYKIKDGNTVHMVKGAASNAQRNPETAGQSSTASQVPPNAGVPTGMATGAGTDPLAGLTGARYAGFAQMPGAGMFGPDGGMGAPQGPQEMLEMLENPMVQAQFNEAMNNPHVIQMLQNNPMIRDQPMMREMLNNPEMRRMMFDPQFLRMSMQMGRLSRGGGDTMANGGMPAPGVTDNTPQQQQQAGGQNPSGQARAQNPGQQSNPFGMFGGMGGGAQQNPFAMLNAFGGMNPPQNQTGTQNSANPTATTEGDRSASTNNTSTNTNQPSDPSHQSQQNPLASLFGGPTNGQSNPMMEMANRMAQNPEMMRLAMNQLGAMGGTGPMAGGANQQPPSSGSQGQQGQSGQQPAFNPFAMLGGMGGMGGMGNFGAPAQPQDTRPPEEQYAQQLSQLNEMGFYDFERNVRALRMAGGRVEGAVEMLFSGSV